MNVTSSRFGTFEIHEDNVLTFPTGLLGFPQHRRYVLLDHDTDAPFKWLQSLEEPGLAFVIINPALFHPQYHVTYSADALAEVAGGDGEEMTIAVILTIPSDDPGRITANLRGPLLMNPRTHLCKQLVLADDVPTRYPLFSMTSLDSAGVAQPPLTTTACPA